jgi:hypothetical protein
MKLSKRIFITLDNEVVENGKKTAKNQKRTFSKYIEYLIEQDLIKAQNPNQPLNR